MIQQYPTERAVLITQAARDACAEFSRMVSRVTLRDADAIRAGKWDETEDVRWFARLLASQAAQPAEADGVERLREAAQGLLDACYTRSLRGRDHVPSMRAEQDARRALEKALAATPKASTSTAGEVERNLEAQRQTIEACARAVETSWVIDGHMKERVAASVRALRPNAALATPPAPNDDLRAALEALAPFARHVGKRGEAITLKWGADSWTGTLKPEDFYRAADICRAALKENRRG